MEQRSESARELLRGIPAVDVVLERFSGLLEAYPRLLALRAIRLALDEVRARIRTGGPGGPTEADVALALAQVTTPNLRRVVNASGVVLHTNLGRAPLPRRALERVSAIAGGYSNLELDLHEGRRGSRYEPVVELLQGLTGAEDALVVNNNAAAVLLVLSALAKGREAIISRGELVEIGGGFRIPDVMEQSGARLREVGTTNRTRLSDYERALGPDTALLVKVHRSNFAMVGFTEEVDTRALAALAKERGVPLFEDLGSGSLVSMVGGGLTPEQTVREVVSSGAHLVAFSGDKLLGGPQAGILVGNQELIGRVRQHPLNRALRVDKMTVAALEATLELYRDGLASEVPAFALLTQAAAALKRRAETLSRALAENGVRNEVVEVEGQVGGGAMPLAQLVSYACAVLDRPADKLASGLREASPPVVARIVNNQVVLDVRCIPDAEISDVAASVGRAAERASC